VRVLLLSAAVVWPAVSSAQTVAESSPPAGYLAGLRAAGVPTANTAVVVAPLGESRLALALNERRAMNPASTMKLVTTYSALHLLGPAHVFKTEVLTNGSLSGDVLTGNLVFRGNGDPKLVIEQFWLLVDRIRGYGIREIRGDLLLDKSAFAALEHDPALFDGEEGRAYNVGPDALLVNFKSIAVSFVPDASRGVARVIVTPEIAGLRIVRTVPGSNAPCGNRRTQLRADFAAPLAPTFAGAYPLACGERAVYLSALEHDAYFAAVFRALWERQGGTWVGSVRAGSAPPDARRIALGESAPLAQVIRDINKFSNNVMTRQVFLTLGAVATGRPATPQASVRAVRDFLAQRGLASPELVLENGSGLSRNERIAARSLANLLIDAYRGQWMPELMASLPISGVDGTMRTRNVPAGAAHMKTGMLEDVRAIAGFVLAASGQRYVVVAIINHASAGRAQAAHDALLDWVYRSG
jgi:D-alanyl-D-alanine carboxypeptidase/D-alanyl-D-alanine-endopeptidase (penicillin-binding protein 4)